MQDKVILVTGASRGVGKAAAEKLAEQGAHLILVARTQGGLEETDDAIQAAGGTSTLVPMDLTNAGAIVKLAETVAERFGKLDGLIGNAAIIGDLAPVAHTDPKAWDKMLAVNVTANFNLIRAFDPLLAAAKSAKVLFVSDAVTDTPKAYWTCYAATKAALEKIALGYAEEVRHKGICVNLVTPPPTDTRLRRSAMPGEEADKLAQPNDYAEIFVRLMADAVTHTGGTYAA